MLRDTVVTAHLRWLEMRGHTPASVYARERALARMTAWLKAHGEVMPDEQRRSRSPLLHETRAGNGDTSPALLNATAADLAAWRESLTTGPGATVNYVSHASEFYAWAVTAGLRGDNPAAGLPVPKLPRRLPRPVSEEDLMAALACASDRVRPWLILGGWAGFRAREVARLRREGILDSASPPVLLVAADAAKGRRERIVPASQFVLDELRLAGALSGSGWTFRRRDGHRGPNAPHLVSQLANQCLREAGSTATFHALRHRFLTLVYRDTHDLRLVQELAGHASPSTTAGYAAFDRRQAVTAVQDLPVPGRLRVARMHGSIVS